MAKDRSRNSRRVPNLDIQDRMYGKYGADLIEMREQPNPHQAELDAMDAADKGEPNE